MFFFHFRLTAVPLVHAYIRQFSKLNFLSPLDKAMHFPPPPCLLVQLHVHTSYVVHLHYKYARKAWMENAQLVGCSKKLFKQSQMLVMIIIRVNYF